jgi:UDP-N-acetylmuramate dehydrogenase
VDVFYQGKLVSWQLNECEYAYKSSRFMKEDCAIVGARLNLLDATEEEVAYRIKSYDERRAHLPKGKSMGCVFKNLNGESAGKWIEGAGLKGMAIGGAYVSKEHANFIINSGSATVEDICALIRLIKNAVFAQYKVQLQEEIVVLNE